MVRFERRVKQEHQNRDEEERIQAAVIGRGNEGVNGYN